MTLAAASPGDPVRIYYDFLEKLNAKVRHNAPFTYLAYRPVLSKDDDLVGLAFKISYYITINRIFLHMGIHMASFLCRMIPFLPLFMDVLWVGCRWISGREEDRSSSLTTLFFLSVGFLSIHYLGKIPIYWGDCTVL